MHEEPLNAWLLSKLVSIWYLLNAFLLRFSMNSNEIPSYITYTL